MHFKVDIKLSSLTEALVSPLTEREPRDNSSVVCALCTVQCALCNVQCAPQYSTGSDGPDAV